MTAALGDQQASSARRPAIDIDRVLLAAARLFAERGFDGVSTRQLAKASGYPLSSIYYHFSDKETLYREAFACKIDDVIDQIRQRVGRYSDPQQRLLELAAAFFEVFTQDACLMLLVQRDIINASLPGGTLQCQHQHRFFLDMTHELASAASGRMIERETAVIINSLLLGLCEFHLLLQGQTESGTGQATDASRLAALQQAILALLGHP